MACHKSSRSVSAPREEFNILVWGQSNAVSPANSHGPHFSSTGMVSIEGEVPTDVNPRQDNISWIYLGDLIAKTSGRPVNIYNRGGGNQTVRKLALHKLDEALAVLGSHKIDVVIWIQGESDFQEKISYDETKTYYTTIFQKMNKTIDPSRIFLAISGVVDKSPNPTSPITQVQHEIIHDGWATQGLNIDAYRQRFPNWFEPVLAEFDNEGLLYHAKEWFRFFLNKNLI